MTDRPEISRRKRRWRGIVHWQLDAYVARRFAFLFVGNLVCFTLVYVLIDLFENLDSFAERSEGMAELAAVAGRYYAATVPAVFCALLAPIVTLTAGLFTITVFHRSNELVPMLANGRPFWRIALPVLIGGLLVSIATFAVQEFWIPRTAEVIKEVTGAKEGREILRHQTYHDHERGLLIRMREYRVLEKRAEGVMVFSIPKHVSRGRGENEIFIWAQSMRWVVPELGDRRGRWLLEQAQIQRYRHDDQISMSALIPPVSTAPAGALAPLYEWRPEHDLETSLIPEDVEGQKEDVVYMRLGDLRRKMDTSVDRRWTVKYWGRFATPLTAFVLLLVGLPLIDYFGARHIFFGALLSAFVACAYLVSSSIFTNMALQKTIPAALGPWLGPMIFGALGVSWLRYLRH